MAKFLIRQAHGGQAFVILDTAWDYFSAQGYIIIDTLPDEDATPVFRDAAASDVRYVETAGISDPTHPDGAELRNFFEEKVDRTGATTGQVPTLQADGKLKFAAGGGGGGTGVTDHGALTGLGDDDHPQYHNDARGDARYSTLAHTHTYAAENITLAAAGITATDVKGGLLELLGMADDAGSFASNTAKALSLTAGSYVADNDLNVTIGANQIMWLEFKLTFSGTQAATGNLRANFTVPAGVTAEWGPSLDWDAAGSGGTAKQALATQTDTRSFKLQTGVTGIHIRGKFISGATPGTITLNLAPDTTVTAAISRNVGGKVDFERFAA